jgi:hypothetical protein
MPARDLNHDTVCNSLRKNGWTITDDPFVIGYGDMTLFADLGAERTFAAERDGERIVVEIKSFPGPSPVREFQAALGQYELYRGLLEITEPDRQLYLAVSATVYESFFLREAIQVILRRNRVRLIVVDLTQEEILQWIK